MPKSHIMSTFNKDLDTLVHFKLSKDVPSCRKMNQRVNRAIHWHRLFEMCSQMFRKKSAQTRDKTLSRDNGKQNITSDSRLPKNI